MAGNPRRRALLLELEKRTRKAFEDDASKTHLDYLVDWLESGKTALALTHDINDALGWKDEPMSHGSIQRYFKGLSEQADTAIKAARAEGSYAILDSTADIADEKTIDNADAARARNRIASRQYLGERYNPAAFGRKDGGINISVSVAGLHLDALRVRAVVASAPARESDIGGGGMSLDDPSAIAGAIASGEEIVSDAVIEALL